MRLDVHSDMHLELQDFPAYFLFNQDFDVLILAGDIADYENLPWALERMRDFCPNKPILYVPGNHDYYGNDIGNIQFYERVCSEFDIFLMEKNETTINGQHFVGCTLWSNLSSVNGFYDQYVGNQVKSRIADFYHIKNFTLDSILAKARDHYLFLQEKITPESVVITHFSPLLCLDNERFPTNDLTNYFCNNYMNLFDLNPKAWIYGHTHGNRKGKFGNTEVITNQRGYFRECAGVYDPNFIIEI